jgi:hypothetical protein
MCRLGALLLTAPRSRRKGVWWQRVAPSAKAIDEVIDPEIEALSMDDRHKLAALWQKRGGLELRVAAGFSALGLELFEHGTTPTVYEIVGQAVRDEIHHAQISVELAAKYRGDAVQWPAPEPSHIPPFEPTKGAMHAALYVIAMCCINETVACGVLEASLRDAKSPLVRAALQSILTDEVEHARAGWAHLASPWVTPDIKRALPNWLYRLHAAKLRELVEDETPLPGEPFASRGHGMLSRKQSQKVVWETLEGVIFSGFRTTGIDPSLAEAWARKAFEDASLRA